MGTIRLFMDNALFFSFNDAENSKDYSLLSMKLSEEVNTLSHLSLTALFTHPRIREIIPRKSTFVLTDDNECMFIGKVLTISRNMSNEVSIEVEDLLGFLRDILRPGYEYTSRTDTRYQSYEFNGLTPDEFHDTISSVYYDVYWKGYLKAAYYNSLYTIPNGKALRHVDNGNDYTISPASLDIDVPRSQSDGTYLNDEISNKDATNIAAFKNWLSVLYDDVNAEAGGVIIPKALGSVSEVGTKSVDYTISEYTIWYMLKPLQDNQNRDSHGALQKPSYQTEPDFEFGKNLIEFEIEPAVNDPTTAIVPTGTYKWPNEDQGRLVMLDQNYNDYAVMHEKAALKYGRIEKNIDFSDIGVFNLYADAQSALRIKCLEFVNQRLGAFGDRITVTGIDKYYLGKSESRIKLLSMAHVVSSPHDVDIYDYCLSYEVDFFNHERDKYIIGPFIPSNYFEYKSTNVKRKAAEEIIANGEQYKRETGGLYTDNSYVRSVQYLWKGGDIIVNDL